MSATCIKKSIAPTVSNGATRIFICVSTELDCRQRRDHHFAAEPTQEPHLGYLMAGIRCRQSSADILPFV